MLRYRKFFTSAAGKCGSGRYLWHGYRCGEYLYRTTQYGSEISGRGCWGDLRTYYREEFSHRIWQNGIWYHHWKSTVGLCFFQWRQSSVKDQICHGFRKKYRVLWCFYRTGSGDSCSGWNAGVCAAGSGLKCKGTYAHPHNSASGKFCKIPYVSGRYVWRGTVSLHSAAAGCDRKAFVNGGDADRRPDTYIYHSNGADGSAGKFQFSDDRWRVSCAGENKKFHSRLLSGRSCRFCTWHCYRKQQKVSLRRENGTFGDGTERYRYLQIPHKSGKTVSAVWTGTVSAGCTSGDIPGTGKTVVPFYQQSAGGGLWWPADAFFE